MSLWQYARAQWDRVGAGALFALGALGLILGWIGVSREALTALQIPYIISGGLGGIFLLGLGAVFWLSADLRDEWRKLDALETAVRGDRTIESSPIAPESPVDWLDADDLPPLVAAAVVPVEDTGSVPASASNGSTARRRRPVRAKA